MGRRQGRGDRGNSKRERGEVKDKEGQGLNEVSGVAYHIILREESDGLPDSARDKVGGVTQEDGAVGEGSVPSSCEVRLVCTLWYGLCPGLQLKMKS